MLAGFVIIIVLAVMILNRNSYRLGYYIQNPEPISGTITKVWSRSFVSNETRGYLSRPVSADINGDHIQDIILTTSDGRLFILNGEDGSSIFKNIIGSSLCAPELIRFGKLRGGAILVGGSLNGQGFFGSPFPAFFIQAVK